jgi:hypothetical protein
MGGTVKAWKQKASAWIKRALIIAGIVIATSVGLFLAYKAYQGATKNRLRAQIAMLQAQVSEGGSAGGLTSSAVQFETLRVLTNLANK